MKNENVRHYLPYLVESDCEAGKICKPYLDLWFESPDGSCYNFDPEQGDLLLDLDHNVIPIEVLPYYGNSEPDRLYFLLNVTDKFGCKSCVIFSTYIEFLSYRKEHEHLWRDFVLTKVFLMPDSM